MNNPWCANVTETLRIYKPLSAGRTDKHPSQELHFWRWVDIPSRISIFSERYIMTSANVVYYKVYRDGTLILDDHQHLLCKNTIDEKLYSIDNPDECTLVTIWPDEYECPHEGENNLAAFLAEKTRRKLQQKKYCGDYMYLKNKGYTLEQIQSMSKFKRALILWWRDIYK